MVIPMTDPVYPQQFIVVTYTPITIILVINQLNAQMLVL